MRPATVHLEPWPPSSDEALPVQKTVLVVFPGRTYGLFRHDSTASLNPLGGPVAFILLDDRFARVSPIGQLSLWQLFSRKLPHLSASIC